MVQEIWNQSPVTVTGSLNVMAIEASKTTSVSPSAGVVLETDGALASGAHTVLWAPNPVNVSTA